MNIVILGATGMLGSMVSNELLNKHIIYETYRNEQSKKLILNPENSFLFDPLNTSTWDNIPKNVDYILNCIGIIKPFMNDNLEDNIFINSVFPHKLAKYAQENNIKLIHITTDCVFSGKTGNYTEVSLHDALDEYGKSKSLGEPHQNSMVIRTSIIGPEKHKNASLISWAISMKGKPINGFLNHFWNGVTTKQYAKACNHIMNNDLFNVGLYHIFSPAPVNKYELLQLINKRYDLNLIITPINDKQSINRTINSVKTLNEKLNIPDLETQIMEL
jgi:dTDP-4-dehydrorhamnose reductase